jgi:methionyl-tRNA formyltransferase
VRIAFLGSPAFAVPALRALVAAGHEVAAVYSQPPRPAHRGQAMTRCAVHEAADALGIAVRTPARVKRDADEHAAFAALGLDAAVVAAYGLILPAAMLQAPRLGCLNIHASLLPRWRGAAPIHAAVLAGDAETGITIMQMDEGLDTGAMLLRRAVPIGPRATTPELHDALAALGAEMIVPALAARADGTLKAVAQPEAGVTYAAKLTRDDGRLDFARDAAALDRQIRALTPWPGSFATFGGAALKVLAAEPVTGSGQSGSGQSGSGGAGSGGAGAVLGADFTVACGAGALRLLRVQRAGRPAVAGDAFLRGVPGWQELRVS